MQFQFLENDSTYMDIFIDKKLKLGINIIGEGDDDYLHPPEPIHAMLSPNHRNSYFPLFST